MVNGIKYVMIMACCLLFARCSWVENFVIMNASEKAIYVSYQLDKKHPTFPLFYDHPTVYHLTNSKEIDWTKEVPIKNEFDKDLNEVSIPVPPHCALVFGGLQNDKYTSYNQYFINGRVFNLQRLDITAFNKTLTIIPNTFDQYFKKHHGQIQYGFK